MSVTISEAVRELLAGRLRLTAPDGAVVEVVPDRAHAADAGDWGPPYLDPPFPALAVSGEPATNVRLGDPFPFTPIVITDDDLLPE